MQPPSVKPSSLIKPTVDTPYHIDYSWFDRSSEDLRREILSHLSAEQRDRFIQEAEPRDIDYVDPATAEVSRVDELEYAIRQAALEPGFIGPQISVIDSVFRVFLSNGNTPLSPVQLSEVLGRPAKTILGVISGKQIYKGIRPAP